MPLLLLCSAFFHKSLRFFILPFKDSSSLKISSYLPSSLLPPTIPFRAFYFRYFLHPYAPNTSPSHNLYSSSRKNLVEISKDDRIIINISISKNIYIFFLRLSLYPRRPLPHPVPRDHLTTRRPGEELTLRRAYRALASLGLLMLIDASGFVPSRRVADASNILINIVIKPPGRQFAGPSSPPLPSSLPRSVSSNYLGEGIHPGQLLKRAPNG